MSEYLLEITMDLSDEEFMDLKKRHKVNNNYSEVDEEENQYEVLCM